MYPIYPLFGLAAAITWTCAESCLKALRLSEKFTQYLTLILVVSSSVISVSRVIGQYKGKKKVPSILYADCNLISFNCHNRISRTHGRVFGTESFIVGK